MSGKRQREARRKRQPRQALPPTEAPQPAAPPPRDDLWSRIRAALSVSGQPVRTRTIVMLSAVAWALGLVIRLLWLGGVEGDFWQSPAGDLIPTTDDAFYYGSGVLDALGELAHDNRRMPGPGDNVLIALGAALGSILPVAPESLLTYLPASLAGLVAIPLILIGRLLGSAWWGFSAALITAIGYSYFIRTVPGYYDTDMVSLTVLLGVVGFLMAALLRGRHLWATCAALLALAMPWFHVGSATILIGTALTLIAYVLIFEGRRIEARALAITFAAASLPVPWPVAALLILAIHVVMARRLPIPFWAAESALALATVGLLMSHSGKSLLAALPVVSDLVASPGGGGAGIGFKGMSAYVIENRVIPLAGLAERIAGNVPLLVVAGAGYLLSVVRHPTLLLALPLLGVGTVFASSAGLRFTTYAVPVAALGLTYLVYLASRHLGGRFRTRKPLVSGICAAAMTLGLLVPAVTFATRHPLIPVVVKHEVATMQRLKTLVKPGDYAITWWDYAYRLWFYTGLSTLIDGMKNNRDNFIVSQALFTDSARASANLSRLAVERYASADKSSMLPIIRSLLRQWRKETPGNPKAGLTRLDEASYEPPASTRDIYYYLPWRMIHIAPVVQDFRRARGLSQADQSVEPLFHLTPRVDARQKRLRLGSGNLYDESRGAIVKGTRLRPLRDIYRLRRARPDARLERQHAVFNPEALLSAVALEHRNMFLLLDQQTLRSLFVQMLIFESYDSRFFELVGRSHDAIIYRLKR